MARWVDPVYLDRTRACPTQIGGLRDTPENCNQVTVARVELNEETWWVCAECLGYIDDAADGGDPTAPIVLIRP